MEIVACHEHETWIAHVYADNGCARANGRLLAAAPELYEVLADMLDALDGLPLPLLTRLICDVEYRARTVLAKARGS
jgi:hypothetical protein